MRNKWKPKKGDTVFVHSGDTRHSNRTGIVKSSGTKWIVLEDNEFRFDAETKQSEYCNYTLYPSEEAYVEDLKRFEMLRKLIARMDIWKLGPIITIKQIQRINDVLDEVEHFIDDETK